MKTCTKCGEAKELDAYHVDKRASDGARSQCIACTRIEQAAYRATNPLARCYRPGPTPLSRKKSHKAWKVRNPEKVRKLRKEDRAAWRDRLADGYLKQVLNVGRGAAVPVAILKAKREQLRLHRLALEMKRATTKEDHEAIN